MRAGAATREADVRHMAELKAETLARLQEAVPGLKPIGSGTAPHILAVTLPGYKSEVIVRFLSDRGIDVYKRQAPGRGPWGRRGSGVPPCPPRYSWTARGCKYTAPGQ